MLFECCGYWINSDDIIMMKGIVHHVEPTGDEILGTEIWFRNAPGSVKITAPINAVRDKLDRLGELSKYDSKLYGKD